MYKVWILVKREYKAAVRTKGFIISLIVLPIFMGGGGAAYWLLKDKVDLTDKTILVIDESEKVGSYLVSAAQTRNANETNDNETGEKIRPAYILSLVNKEADFGEQKLTLSEKVRDKEIHAFIHIGPDVINPGSDRETARIIYYGENSSMDVARNWISENANTFIRKQRVAQMGLSESDIQTLFSPVWAEGMGLVSVDSKTGSVVDAKRSSELEGFLVPYVMMLLIFMMIMMSAIPLLQAVMEEKSYRIAEVLLGSVTPWQFMLGKVLGGLAVSLTIAAIYIGGITFTLGKMDLPFTIPYDVLPWFFVYLVFAVVMFGTIFAALGSTCNDSKDAQNIQFPAMLPVIIPMFLMMPIIQNPLSNFSMWVSLFPPFTPTLMLVRQASPVTVPMWQPLVGVIGMLVFTIIAIWAGGRIFRSSIIMVGKRPKFGTMMKYIIKG